MTPGDGLWRFRPTPKLPSTGRSLPLDETERRIQPLLRRIPVTRVSDLTPLDTIGLPVFSACTPLATDLTVHLGKGVEPTAARLSAVMEAIERVSAEHVEDCRCVVAAVDDRRVSGDPLLDPQWFSLPPMTTYRREDRIRWVAGHDLLHDERVWLPVDLVVNPPNDGVLVDIDTNGLAAGNCRLEAVVHGICEIIERDAYSQIAFCALFADGHDGTVPGRVVDLATVPASTAAVVERLHAAGQHVVLEDITTDLGVATFAGYVMDPSYPTSGGTVPMLFLGLGTHPDAGVAARRALLEANQARLARIQGARDSYNTVPAPLRTSTLLDLRRRIAPAPPVHFDDVESAPSGDVLDDLHYLLDKLFRAGVERCVVVDVTRADLGVPVVRVRIPGLSQFFVDFRRVDARCWRWLL